MNKKGFLSRQFLAALALGLAVGAPGLSPGPALAGNTKGQTGKPPQRLRLFSADLKVPLANPGFGLGAGIEWIKPVDSPAQRTALGSGSIQQPAPASRLAWSSILGPAPGAAPGAKTGEEGILSGLGQRQETASKALDADLSEESASQAAGAVIESGRSQETHEPQAPAFAPGSLVSRPSPSRLSPQNSERAPPSSPAVKTLLYVVSKLAGRDYLYEEVFRQAVAKGFKVAILGYPGQRPHAEKLALKSGFDLKGLDYLEADIGSHDPENIGRILQQVQSYREKRPIHAVKTFLNAYALLEAELSHALGAPGYHPDAVRAAHTKNLARRKMNEDPGLFLPYREVLNEEEGARFLEEIQKKQGFSEAVLKVPSGGGGFGVRVHLKTPEDVRRAFSEIREEVKEVIAHNPQKAKSKQVDQWPKNPYLLMEAHIPDGIAFDAEVLIQGEPVFQFLSYNPPPLAGHEERGTTYPANLPPSVAELVRSKVAKALRALGLATGNSHVEGIVTLKNGKIDVFIVEVNARMGGADIWASILEASGVNVMEQGILAAFGLPMEPKPRKNPVLLQHRFLLAAANGRVRRISGMPKPSGPPGLLERLLRLLGLEGPLEDFLRRLGLLKPKVFLSELFVEEGEEVSYGAWLGNVTVRGRDERASRDELFKLLGKIQITIETPDGRVVEQTGLFSHDSEDGRKLAGELMAELKAAAR